MGFTEVLTILFVALKAAGYLDWSWWLVFSPELIAGFIYLLIFAGVIGILGKD